MRGTDQAMTGEDLIHQFFDEVHTWRVEGAVHYRMCSHRGQPHYRADEPCLWMSRETIHAFLTWGVQKGYLTPSGMQTCLRHEELQAASALADAAAAAGEYHPEDAVGLIGLIRRYPLSALLVSLGVGFFWASRVAEGH